MTWIFVDFSVDKFIDQRRVFVWKLLEFHPPPLSISSLYPRLLWRREYTVLALSVRPSFSPKPIFSVVLFAATIHHSHLKLGMVLWLGVLHVTYQIQVRQLSTSCFTARFIFLHTFFFILQFLHFSVFLCPRIERSGAYCFSVVSLSACPSVRLSGCLSVSLHKLNMKT